MRISDIMDLVKFVEATATKGQKESFESQLLRWRNTKTKATAPMSSTMVRSLFILSVSRIKACSTDVSILGTFWGTIAPRQSWYTRSRKTRCLVWTRGPSRRKQKETQEIMVIDFTASDRDEGAFFELTGSFIQVIFVVTDHLPR